MANAQVKNLSVSNSSSSVSFSPAAYLVTITNTGSTTCYFNIGAAATTSHYPLDPGDTIRIGLSTISAVHAITASGTTTLKMIGVAQW